MDLTPDRIVQGLTYFVVLLFSLSFHESAHAWTASRLGDNTARSLGRSWILLVLFVTGALSSVVSPVIVFLRDILFRIALP